jgi:hypothetical protein
MKSKELKRIEAEERQLKHNLLSIADRLHKLQYRGACKKEIAKLNKLIKL